jgi:hypothetical protein
VVKQAAAAVFDAVVAEKIRKPKLCTGCGKPRPDRGSPRCPDCVLEDQRLAAIAKLPTAKALEDEEFEVVWSGKQSLSSMVHTEDADDDFDQEFQR